jgi:hypothetical protein
LYKNSKTKKAKLDICPTLSEQLHISEESLLDAYKGRKTQTNMEAEHQSLVFDKFSDATVVTIAPPPDDNGGTGILMKQCSCTERDKIITKKLHLPSSIFCLSDTPFEENDFSSANRATPDQARSNEKAARHLSLMKLLEQIKDSSNDPKLFRDVFATAFLKAASIEELEDYGGLIVQEQLILRQHALNKKTKQTDNVSQCLTALHERLAFVPVL